MQLLGEGRQDKVEMTYTVSLKEGGDFHLHRLASGAYQTGIGRDARIITDLSQVAMFGADVQGQVAEWLNAQGAQRAMQEKVEQDIHEASMSRPGDIDARLELAEKIAPGIKGEIASVIDQVLAKHGIIRDPGAQSGPGQTGGKMRPATQQEINEMVKAGMAVDLNNPPMVFDPSGDLAGSARTLQDAPDMTEEMRQASERTSSAMDLLEQEQDAALSMGNDIADEFDEAEPAAVGADQPATRTRTAKGPAGRKAGRR